jgi:hypothetical protein
VFSGSKLRYVPGDAQLLLENNGQLFEITADGNIRKYMSLPNNLSDFTVSSDAIAATRGLTKQDGALQSLNDDEQIPLFSSKGVETYFRFAPNSEAIAFVSNRTEALQVWLSENSETPPRQLSQFDTATQISGLEWLEAEAGVALVINDQLARLNMSGELQTYTLPMRVKYLHQVLPNNQVLIEYQHDYQEVIARVDLNTLDITPIYAGLFNDVQLDAQNNLWFVDRSFQLNKLVDGEVTLPVGNMVVNGLRSYKTGVVISNKQKILLYLTDQSEPEQLQSLNSGAWLQDIKATQFIWSHKHARNSDIVKLAITN